MPHHFRPYSPEQPLLWPPDLRDWVARRSPGVHGERVGGCAGSVGVLRPLSAAGIRQPALCAGPDHKILVDGYATGVRSSRRLAQKLEEDVAFQVLAEGNRPQHRILCKFRRRHRADFGAVLVAVVQ